MSRVDCFGQPPRLDRLYGRGNVDETYVHAEFSFTPSLRLRGKTDPLDFCKLFSRRLTRAYVIGLCDKRRGWASRDSWRDRTQTCLGSFCSFPHPYLLIDLLLSNFHRLLDFKSESITR